MKIITAVLAVTLGALLVQRAQAARPERWADTRPEERGPVPAARSLPSISAQEAARKAQSRYGGKVLSVSPEGSGYRVRMLKNGEVRTVYIGP